jgi:hypothetical protein
MGFWMQFHLSSVHNFIDHEMQAAWGIRINTAVAFPVAALKKSICVINVTDALRTSQLSVGRLGN